MGAAAEVLDTDDPVPTLPQGGVLVDWLAAVSIEARRCRLRALVAHAEVERRATRVRSLGCDVRHRDEPPARTWRSSSGWCRQTLNWTVTAVETSRAASDTNHRRQKSHFRQKEIERAFDEETRRGLVRADGVQMKSRLPYGRVISWWWRPPALQGARRLEDAIPSLAWQRAPIDEKRVRIAAYGRREADRIGLPWRPEWTDGYLSPVRRTPGRRPAAALSNLVCKLDRRPPPEWLRLRPDGRWLTDLEMTLVALACGLLPKRIRPDAPPKRVIDAMREAVKKARAQHGSQSIAVYDPTRDRLIRVPIPRGKSTPNRPRQEVSPSSVPIGRGARLAPVSAGKGDGPVRAGNDAGPSLPYPQSVPQPQRGP